MQENQTPMDADLCWLAYRYVAEELSADEAEAFELRLAVDQPAREAVASAVELSQAVACLPAEVFAVAAPRQLASCSEEIHSLRPTRLRTRRQPLALASFAVAASLFLLAVGSWWHWSAAPSGSSADQRLVAAWVQLRSQQTDQGEFLSGDAASVEEAAASERSGPGAESGESDSGLDYESAPGESSHGEFSHHESGVSSHDEAELPAPSWLMAAFDGSAKTAGSQGNSTKSATPEAATSAPSIPAEEK